MHIFIRIDRYFLHINLCLNIAACWIILIVLINIFLVTKYIVESQKNVICLILFWNEGKLYQIQYTARYILDK